MGTSNRIYDQDFSKYTPVYWVKSTDPKEKSKSLILEVKGTHKGDGNDALIQFGGDTYMAALEMTQLLRLQRA